MDGIDKRRTGELQRLIRDDIRVHQNHGKKYQEYDPDSRSHERISFQQKVRRQPAEHQQTKRNNKGVLPALLYYRRKINHPGLPCPWFAVQRCLIAIYTSGSSATGNIGESV